MATRRPRRTSKPSRVKLSKTRYQWGLQCEKRLWLDAHRREFATSPDAGLRARLAQGHRVGDLARERWPGFVLVREPASRHERAETTTRALLADPAVPAICEGAFSFEDLRVRADVVVRNGDRFDLVEVKSTTRVKADHISDAGVQLRVLEGAGVRVARVGLLHLNRDYVWTGGDYDLTKLFELEDITEGARSAAEKVDENARALRSLLTSSDTPSTPVGRHCTLPYECPFRAHCWSRIDYHHVCELPSIENDALQALAAVGISDIAEIDSSRIELSAAQELARRCVTEGQSYVDDEGLAEQLDSLDYPIACIGVAVARIALPAFEDTAPYESVPVAWSMTVLGADGSVSQRSSSVPSRRCDPRPDFFASLAAALPHAGGVVCYEPADLDLIRTGAAKYVPETVSRLSECAVALRSLVEAHYYDAALAGSFALHSVRAAFSLPAVQAAGGDISADFAQWASSDCKPLQRSALCERLAASSQELSTGTRQILQRLVFLAEGDEID
jgi:hypothetical protein